MTSNATRPEILVSVSLITYNQERYIAQAIESALHQVTDFAYDIVLADDCSTDGTWQICQAYQEKYPDKIKAVRHDKNLGAVRNYLDNYERCQGKYVAFLEGDDFFSDPLKLQKQADFLEANPDYVICCHQVEIVDQLGEKQGLLLGDVLETSTVNELCQGDYVSTPSCMVRNIMAGKIPDWIYDLPGCDWPFDILHAEHGLIKYFPEPMSCYRVHQQGIWNTCSIMDKHLIAIDLVQTLNKSLGYRYSKSFKYHLKMNKASIRYIKRQKLAKYRLYRWVRFIKNYLVYELAYPSLRKMKTAFRYFLKIQQCAVRRIISTWIKFYGSSLPKDNIVIIDESFPHPQSAFRYAEFNAYLKYFSKIKIYTTGASYGFFKETRSVREMIRDYLQENPKSKDKVLEYPVVPLLRSHLAYLVFLGNMHYFLQDIEDNKIPFVFTLYPGGTFVLNDKDSDRRLKAVFSSPFFRKVIVTQQITRCYLLEHDFCKPDDIVDIYGVVTPLENLEQIPEGKVFYADGKPNFDICFAAHKYMERGIDKGYDVFIKAAKILAQKYENVRFHVVGGFTANDISVRGMEDRVNFYGNQKTEWFKDFYKDKDIFLSPNKPFVLQPGAFDGFPTGSCTEAAIHEVAMFCTDELNLNCRFTHGKDIVILPYDALRIVEAVESYYKNPEALKQLAKAGREKVQEVYGYESQIAPRIALLEQELSKAKMEKKHA